MLRHPDGPSLLVGPGEGVYVETLAIKYEGKLQS